MYKTETKRIEYIDEIEEVMRIHVNNQKREIPIQEDECEEIALRPRREIKLPKKFDEYEVEIGGLALLSDFSSNPKSYSQANQSGD